MSINYKQNVKFRNTLRQPHYGTVAVTLAWAMCDKMPKKSESNDKKALGTLPCKPKIL